MTDSKEDQSKKPEDSAFKQQRLIAWQPLLTPPWVIGTFFFTGILFLILGGVILQASRSVVEVEVRYDGCAIPPNICTINMPIPATMNPPIFFYYKLTNFYQNHRRYVKSRDDTQLSGSVDINPEVCDPIRTNSAGLTYYPCGLIANSFFNDTFDGFYCPAGSNCISLNSTGNWRKDGIAWSSDLSKKFIPRSLTSQETNIGTGGFQLPPVNDEDFVVWMRTAGLPTFKKLHRRIVNMTFNAGDVVAVNVLDTFPVAGFSGQKSMVLSTTSWMGGKNDFLGIAYLVVGSLCMLLGAVFFFKHWLCPRNLGDTTYLKNPTVVSQ